MSVSVSVTLPVTVAHRGWARKHCMRRRRSGGARHTHERPDHPVEEQRQEELLPQTRSLEDEVQPLVLHWDGSVRRFCDVQSQYGIGCSPVHYDWTLAPPTAHLALPTYPS